MLQSRAPPRFINVRSRHTGAINNSVYRRAVADIGGVVVVVARRGQRRCTDGRRRGGARGPPCSSRLFRAPAAAAAANFAARVRQCYYSPPWDAQFYRFCVSARETRSALFTTKTFRPGRVARVNALWRFFIIIIISGRGSFPASGEYDRTRFQY